MTDIRSNLERIRERMASAALAAGRKPEEIALIVVTKTQDAAAVRSADVPGVFAYGENRVQEFLEKRAQNAYGDHPVHLIGSLQKNKVGKVVGNVSLIQSVDSPELAECISKKAVSLGLVQDILIEVNIGREETKGGVDPDEAGSLAASLASLPGIRVRGLMAVPPRAEQSAGNLKYFEEMQKLFVDIGSKKYDNVSMDGCVFDILSMGMSDDFETAIAAGSTMIRVGSAIFGPRVRNPFI